MGEQSPQSHNVGPRNFGVGSAPCLGHRAGRLADDLEQALDGKLSDPVRAERLFTIGDNPLDLVGRIDDVCEGVGDLARPPLEVDRLVEDVLVPWLQSSGGDHIDVPTEEALQFRGEVEHVEQRASRLEVDKEIDVAIGTVVAARGRPEEPHSSSAAPSRRRPYLLAVLVE
jgi:hypothetical protein